MTPMENLLDYLKTTGAIEQVAGRMNWDQETMMPPGAQAQRAEEMGALEGLLHARRTDPQFGDLLSRAVPRTPSEQAILREARREFERNLSVPASLASEIARVISAAQGKWAKARAADDFASFAPVLAEVLELRRAEGQAIAGDGDPYDALLADYEPGTSSEEIAALFNALRAPLVELRNAVLDRPAPDKLRGEFDAPQQMAMARELAIAFGYDLTRGRVDLAVHPFSSGSGQDVRITTRVVADDPLNCLYSTIHETGHACYEQNISDDYLFTPLGKGVSMGVHESQSRIYENQLGRSRPLCHWLHGRMFERFGDMGLDGPEAFYRAVNRVTAGFIRTEADELSYNLHVMLRFDLERKLIRGELEVDDLEEAWNARVSSDFGVVVPRASQGVLQDVHWPIGLMGYFPTYALGNIYAGCLMEEIRENVVDLDDHLAEGDPSTATSWLAENLQQYGGLYQPREVIERASRRQISHKPLFEYLERKFTDLYAL